MEMTKEEKARDYKLRKRYGITLEEYNRLLESQGNKCAICGKPAEEEKQALAVDHNHKTDFTRGLVCNYCNSRLLKYLRDDKRRAVGLHRYLELALRLDRGWNYGDE